MQAPKYQAEVDLSNQNTSHALLVRLARDAARVLDVGCATGYLAQALREAGSAVSGIEYDVAAAEQARPHLDTLVVGDVERLDLVGEFGSGSFDAVVYGDVLEHLVDPATTLVRTRELLAEGGRVVASIPNVAHGAVRLSLLGGEFPYTETGLLDRTHLRFFTRATVEALFRDAGYTLVELLRTTVGVFDTELGLRAGDFSPEVVELVLDDPESTTYQFVVVATPTALSGDDGAARAAEERRAAAHRRERAVARPVAVDASAEPVRLSAGARVGIAGSFDLDQFRTALLARITVAELGRRLPAATFRLFSPYGSDSGSRMDPGAPVEALGSFGVDRARRLGAQLDVLVVTGTVPADAGVAAALYGGAPHDDLPTMFLTRGLSAAGPEPAPTIWSAVDVFPPPPPSSPAPAVVYAGLLDGQGAEAGRDAAGAGQLRDGTAEPPDVGGEVLAVAADLRAGAAELSTVADLPDPGVLVRRLLDPAVLERRLTYLRVIGRYPAAGPVLVVHGDGRLTEHAAAIAAVLDRLQDRHPTLSLVLAELDPVRGDGAFLNVLSAELLRPPEMLSVDTGIDDILAVLAGADVVVSTAPTPLAVAAAYGGRAVAVDFFGDAALAGDAALVDGSARVSTVETLDRQLRDLGDLLSVIAPSPRSAPQRLVEAQARLDSHFDRVAEIAAAAAAEPAAPAAPGSRNGVTSDLGRRLAVLERAHAAVRSRANAERVAMADAIVGARAQTVDHEPELRRLQTELSALYNSKTLRAMRPARAVYARLRGHRL